MNARICSNPSCRTILPSFKCHLCGSTTDALPYIPLASIGISGTARLTHRSNRGYAITVKAPSGSYNLPVSLSDLLRSAQLHLPDLNPVSGLTIMDALKHAATLIQTRSSGCWPGWVIYLLETLQDHADPAAFQQVLKDLRRDLNTCLAQDDDIPPIHDTTEHHEPKWSKGRGYVPPETP